MEDEDGGFEVGVGVEHEATIHAGGRLLVLDDGFPRTTCSFSLLLILWHTLYMAAQCIESYCGHRCNARYVEHLST